MNKQKRDSGEELLTKLDKLHNLVLSHSNVPKNANEEQDLSDWASKIMSLLPILGLIAMGVVALFIGFPAENKTEIGIVIAGLIALSKDVYGYKYGSSRKGNSQ